MTTKEQLIVEARLLGQDYVEFGHDMQWRWELVGGADVPNEAHYFDGYCIVDTSDCIVTHKGKAGFFFGDRENERPEEDIGPFETFEMAYRVMSKVGMRRRA